VIHEAEFYCPELVKMTKGKAFHQLKRDPLTHLHLKDDGTLFDGGGHQSWVYQWKDGDTHENPPNCALCGELLLFVAGDKP
jgi:hypothetical protein